MENMKNNKRTAIIIAICAIVVVAIIIGTVIFINSSKDTSTDKAASGVSQQKDVNSEKAKGSDTNEKDVAPEKSDEKQGESKTKQQSEAKQELKYGDAEVYKDKNGEMAAKTEDGTEVEITQENFNKLMEEYKKVQNSGSEKEKEILDKLQLILEVTQSQKTSE